MRSDIEKTSDELLSDSCFQLLDSCNRRIAEVEAKLAELREAGKGMNWNTPEERTNYLEQQYACGELLGLSYMQGALEAHVRIKTDLARIAREHFEAGLAACGQIL